MILLDCQQGTPEWFAIRRGLPTASQFSRIVTASGKPSSSQDALIGELIDELVNPNSDYGFDGNSHTARGKELEPKARNWYRFVTGSNVVEVGFVLRDDRLIGCSPDSIVDDCGGMEIKAPEGKKHVMWMLDGALPEEHKQQVHGSLAITGLDFWDFVSYCPGYKPFRVRVLPDKYTEIMRKELDAFVARLEKAKAQFVDYIGLRKAA